MILNYDKIASAGEGRKPNSDREKYIAESELALLSILSKQSLMIYFYLDSSEQHGWKQIRKAVARMWEDSLTQPCVIIANLQNILEIRLKDDQHASCMDFRH